MTSNEELRKQIARVVVMGVAVGFLGYTAAIVLWPVFEVIIWPYYLGGGR